MAKKIMKGNEKDCICEKLKGEHREYCNAYRFSEFIKKLAGVLYFNRSNQP